jgi:hypothetical protein
MHLERRHPLCMSICCFFVQVCLAMLKEGAEGDAWRPLYVPPDRRLVRFDFWRTKLEALKADLHKGSAHTWNEQR